jgi:hypothetical protein
MARHSKLIVRVILPLQDSAKETINVRVQSKGYLERLVKTGTTVQEFTFSASAVYVEEEVGQVFRKVVHSVSMGLSLFLCRCELRSG